MTDSKYKILEEKNRLLEAENKRLHIELENKNKIGFKNQQKSTTQNLNSLILNNVSAGIYLIETKTGNILYANPTFEKMFGYDTDELVGKNVSIVNAETEKPANEVAFDIIQKLEEFGSWEGEVANVKKDGTVFYCAATVSTFDHPEYGSVWISTHKDITEQKETREILLQSKVNILAILENTTDSIWAINTSYEILYANDVFASAFNDNFGVRLKPGDNLLLSLPESLKEQWKSRYDRVLSNETFSFTDKIDTENGSVYIEVFMNPIVLEGEVVGGSFFGKIITDRFQTEEALKESQLLLTSSIESQNDTILFSINNKYQYLYFNKAHSDSMKFAYNKDIEIGMNILDCITSEDDWIAAKENYDRALMGESHTNVRIYGEENRAYYESFFNPILNDKNEIIGATGLARDITSRKKGEEALKESESNLNSLINNRNESIWSIDNNYSYKILNSLFKESYYKAYNIDLQPGMKAMSMLSPELKEFWKEKYDIALSGEKISFEFSSPMGNELYFYEVFLSPIISDGEVTGVSGLSINITDRKKTDEELKKSLSLLTATLESTVDGILVVDNSGKSLTYNDKFVQLWQIPDSVLSTGDDEILIASVLDQLSDPDGFLKKVKEMYSSEDTSFDLLNFKDGRIFERYSQPQILEGKSIGRVWSFRDITERKRAEQALKESETQLKELNATKDKLFTIIAHDLRSPFHNILGLSELLIENVKDFEVEKLEKYLGYINSSAGNTLILLDNLLNWAKSQTGELNYKPEKIILSEVILEIIKLKKSLATAKNISLHYSPINEIEFYTDKNILKTILRNLISNAVKFTNVGGHVNVLTTTNQHQIEISISDNGVGMNEKTIHKLFDLSTNVTSPGTANEGGSGLGLVLCKEFVEKLGGDIWVESQEGKGSDFKFTIPLNGSE